MATEVRMDIWNKALSRIGQSTFIDDENDTGIAAVTCLLHWDDCLREVLHRFPWSFATKQAEISQPDGVEREGWEYVYNLPSDCVRPIALLAEDERPGLQSVADRRPFAIMASDTGSSSILCCDLDDDDFEVLQYVYFNESVQTYSASFIDCVAWRLAAELAPALTKNNQHQARALQMYESALSQATADDRNQVTRDALPKTPTFASRG